MSSSQRSDGSNVAFRWLEMEDEVQNDHLKTA